MITTNPLNERTSNRQGFALIATISVMTLLVMVCLAMLSLSTIELRQQNNATHQQTARANARLALMLALGDLQKYAGADRRVTASASILDDSVNTHKRNWTTVWDTSNWSVTDPVNSRDNNAYMAALVSRRDVNLPSTRAEATADLATAVPTSDPTWIRLVSDGSVDIEADYVYAEGIDTNDSDSRGTYAYWVGDEGVKARFDVGRDDDHIAETWATAGRMGLPGGTGIHKIEGMEQYTDYLSGGASEEDLDKFIGFKSLDLSTIEQQVIKKNFHHVTTSHTGLLVDNRWGGIRRDLSTAFEMDLEDFGEIGEFNASGEQNKTDIYSSFIPNDVTSNPLYYSQDTDDELGYVYEVPVDSSKRYRGPTWDILRNHYRIYKKERNDLNFRGVSVPSNSDALVAHSVVPFSYVNDPNATTPNSSLGAWVAGPHFKSGLTYQIPQVADHGIGGGYDMRNGGKTQPTVQKIAPQLIRTILVYGLAKEDNEYFLTIDPYFVLHNPYNQPLEFYSLSVDFNGLTLVLDFTAKYKEDVGGNLVDREQTFEVAAGWGLKALQSFRLTAPTSGNHRLEAGEIKVMSVANNAGHDDLGGGVKAISLTELQYNEGAGIYLGSQGETMNVADGTAITVEAEFINQIVPGSVFTRLLHPLKATGGAFGLEDITTFNDEANFNRHNDYEEISLIQQMRIISQEQNTTLSDTVSANVSQIPNPRDGSFYLYALDLSMKDFSGDVAVIGDFNSRAMGFGPRDYDGADHIAPNWEFELKRSDLLDLQFTDANSRGYWGEGKTPSDGGSSRVVLFDLPRSPIASMAALQHADTSKYNFHAMHSIANSRLQVGQTDQRKIFNRLTQEKWATTPKYQIDTSWAANEALWDRYYFSGMNWGSMSGQPFSTHDTAAQAIVDGEAHRVLVNPRMKMISQPSSDDMEQLKDYKEIGNYLAIEGAFNVNSTSVEAWKAVLASMSGREISYLAGANLTNQKIDPEHSPMSRLTTPAGWDDDDYSGFRALDDKELTELADAIVTQVKLRGPFMGLSDFVNRRLVADDTGKSGAIQAAIDESDINNSVDMGNTDNNRLKQSAPTANQGMSRHLNQGDVLTSLAPIMATRSDTFVIRTYGDSKDANGVIQARAWCEATVQRIPKWLADTDQSSTVQHSDYPTGNSTAEPILRQWEENPNLPEVNKTFGRKFVIQSFRWLAPNEV